MTRKKAFSFRACMALMRSRDAQSREDGFHRLLPHASEHVPELLAELRAEDDRGLRCWLLELVASARAPEATAVLAESLASEDAGQRSWAIRGLAALGTAEARGLLWDARSSTFRTVEETEAFREELRKAGG